MKGKIIIRPAGSTDLAKINAIFNYYVAHSTCVWTAVPCSEAERAAWYEEHDGSMPVLVAERGGHVVGWGALGSFRTAYTLAGTLEDSVYVHHDFLRQGIGSRLLTELIAAARRIGLRSILANISADQTPSRRGRTRTTAARLLSGRAASLAGWTKPLRRAGDVTGEARGNGSRFPS